MINYVICVWGMRGKPIDDKQLQKKGEVWVWEGHENNYVIYEQPHSVVHIWVIKVIAL